MTVYKIASGDCDVLPDQSSCSVPFAVYVPVLPVFEIFVAENTAPVVVIPVGTVQVPDAVVQNRIFNCLIAVLILEVKRKS